MSAAARLGVLGWPVAHSLSPQMQNAALMAASLGGWRYQLLPVPPGLLAPVIRALEGAGFRGANVTIPHKLAALALADESSESARAIGAANTLLFARGRIRAENTDAPALIASLPIDPRGRSALVLGAGGSARAAVWALLHAGASEVRIWNRTPERARALGEALGATAVRETGRADLLVNCTPGAIVDRAPGVKSIAAVADEVTMFQCVVDFSYGRAETPLVRAARSAGIPVVDGLELLVRQGALSFERFTGLPAPMEAMRAALREAVRG